MLTLLFLFPIVNAGLIVFGHGWKQLPAVDVDTHARAQWPDHPFINAQDKFKNTFGGSSAVAIAVVVEEGTIFTPEVLPRSVGLPRDSMDRALIVAVKSATNSTTNSKKKAHRPKPSERSWTPLFRRIRSTTTGSTRSQPEIHV